MSELPDETEFKEKLDRIVEKVRSNPSKSFEAMSQLATLGENLIDSMTDEKKWEEEYDADLLLSDLQKFPRDRLGEICVFLEENIRIKTEYTRIEKTKIDVSWDGFFKEAETPITFDVILFEGFPYDDQDEFPSNTYVSCVKCDKEIIEKEAYTIDNKEQSFSSAPDPSTHFLLYLVAHFFKHEKGEV